MDEIIANVASSKKYNHLYETTITRIVHEAGRRYNNPKDIEKEAKKQLHLVWDAFYNMRIDFDKILPKIEVRLDEGDDVKDILSDIMRIHSSTYERLPIIEEFYKKIFEVTGKPSSIDDIGCGFNPLTIPWMELDSQCIYRAYDIDTQEIELLNTINKLFPASFHNFEATPHDIISENVTKADVAFLFKLLQVLEQQKKGVAIEILQKIPCKHLVVSFPMKSLSGKEKGMGSFYEKWLEELVKNQAWTLTKLPFENELVYVVKK